MQAWVDEALSRATPLTIFQETVIKAAFRTVKLDEIPGCRSGENT